MGKTASRELVLRHARTEDSADIATIWHSGWQDGHLGHVPAALVPHRGPADFRRRVPGQLASTTVATIGSGVAGFVTVRNDEIEQLYVALAARGTGVAAVLLRRGEQIIAGRHRTAWLAVAGGNARARRFYERNDWNDTGPVDYAAATADGGTVSVPCRRYEKHMTPDSAPDTAEPRARHGRSDR